MSKHCCDRMDYDLAQICDIHPDRFDCPDSLVSVDSHGRFGLIIHDGASSVIGINFCPWCGVKLPEDAEA